MKPLIPLLTMAANLKRIYENWNNPLASSGTIAQPHLLTLSHRELFFSPRAVCYLMRCHLNPVVSPFCVVAE